MTRKIVLISFTCFLVKKKLKTTQGNLDIHRDNMEFTSLPRTFTDAIIFTRKLGLKYLWIDSLCIVQDDQDDWHHEPGVMANIYENAVLTLGATASACTHDANFLTSCMMSHCLSGDGFSRNGFCHLVFCISHLMK